MLTAIEPLGRFWRAEDYHQKYALRRHAEPMRAFAAYTPRTFTDSTVAARLNAFVSGPWEPGAAAHQGAAAPRGPGL